MCRSHYERQEKETCPFCRLSFNQEVSLETEKEERLNLKMSAYVTCAQCEKKLTMKATKKCFTCGFLCIQCHDSHTTMKIFKNHEISFAPVENCLNSDKHKDKKNGSFCKKCQKGVCEECVLESHGACQSEICTSHQWLEESVQNSAINRLEIPQMIKYILEQLHTIEKIVPSLNNREGIIQQLTKVRESTLSLHTYIKKTEEEMNVKKNTAIEYPGLPTKLFSESCRTENIIATVGIDFDVEEKLERFRNLGDLGYQNKDVDQGDDMKSYAKEKFQCTCNCLNGLASATIFFILYYVYTTWINHVIKYTFINKFITLDAEIINKNSLLINIFTKNLPINLLVNRILFFSLCEC